MIYTPRMVIDALMHPIGMRMMNKSVCTKIEYKGFEISIAMDSSHGDGDLFRSDIRVYTAPGAVEGVECTSEFMGRGETMIYGTGEELARLFKMIDARSAD